MLLQKVLLNGLRKEACGEHADMYGCAVDRFLVALSHVLHM